MKILILNYEYPPLGGGGGVFCRDLAEAWALEGHEVDVLTSRAKGLARQEKNAGVTIFRVFSGPRKNEKQASFLNLLLFLFFGFFKALKLAYKNDYDLLNTQFVLPTGPLGYALQLFFKVPNILNLHGADIYDPSRKMSGHNFWITRKTVEICVKKASHVITATPEIKNKAEEYFKIPKAKIKIIPLGFKVRSVLVNNEGRSEVNLDAPLKLVSIGRLVKRKNYQLLLAALKILKKKNIKVSLKILSNGPLLAELKEKIVKLELEDQVEFLGTVSEAEKFRELFKADVYVSSAAHEGFGLVFLEAMHAGLPIIASDNGGQTYFLKEKENALFFKNNDADDLAEKIDFLNNNRDNLNQLGENNQKRVLDFYIEEIAGKYLRLVR